MTAPPDGSTRRGGFLCRSGSSCVAVAATAQGQQGVFPVGGARTSDVAVAGAQSVFLADALR